MFKVKVLWTTFSRDSSVFIEWHLLRCHMTCCTNQDPRFRISYISMQKSQKVLTLWPTVTICKTVCSLQMEFKTWQIKDLCCVYILSVTISWVLVRTAKHEQQKNWAVQLKDSTWTCSRAKLYTGCVKLYTGVLLLNPCPLYWNQIEFWCALRFLPLLDVT